MDTSKGARLLIHSCLFVGEQIPSPILLAVAIPRGHSVSTDGALRRVGGENHYLLWQLSGGNWLAGRGAWDIGVFAFKGYRPVMVINPGDRSITFESKNPNTPRTSAC